jgi:hypothetical protein
MDESGMIRTQMGKPNKSEMATVHGTLCTTPARNSNEYSENVERVGSVRIRNPVVQLWAYPRS